MDVVSQSDAFWILHLLGASKEPIADKILEKYLTQQPISSNMLSCIQTTILILFWRLLLKFAPKWNLPLQQLKNLELGLWRTAFLLIWRRYNSRSYDSWWQQDTEMAIE